MTIYSLVSVEPRENYRIYLKFADGICGEVSVRALTRFKGVFEPLQDWDYFRRVAIDPESGTITWPNEADIDPLTLYARVTGRPLVFDRLTFETPLLTLPSNIQFLERVRTWAIATLNSNEHRDALQPLLELWKPSYRHSSKKTRVSFAFEQSDPLFEDIERARELNVILIRSFSKNRAALTHLGATRVTLQPCVLLDWPNDLPTTVLPRLSAAR